MHSQRFKQSNQYRSCSSSLCKECGNYKDHSLFAAKEYAKIVLDQGISLDPFERIL